MTIAEIAQAADMHRVSIARLARQGLIPGLGRATNGRYAVIDPARVQAWAASTMDRQRRRYANMQPGRDDDDAIGSYSTGELSARLGVSQQTIRNRARRGQIPGAIRNGRSFRFDRAKADRYCDDLAHGSKDPPSRRLGNAIEQLQRCTRRLRDLCAKFGVQGFRPQLREIAQTIRELAE